MKSANAFLVLAMLAGTAAQSAEGRLELSQTCAVFLGCTTGDSLGYPITISAPGAYLLTSNLTVATANDTAILVQADGVSIDLNGFAILGPVSCTGTVPTCTPTGGTGRGIDASGFGGLAVRNGTIQGMGGIGISSARPARVDSVHVLSNGGAGISIGGGVVNHCSVNNNGAAGVNMLGLATDNEIWNNKLAGLATFGPNLGYSGNVITENNTGTSTAQVVGGGTQIGTNLCGSTSINANTTCP